MADRLLKQAGSLVMILADVHEWQIDCVNKQGLLLDVVQALTDLNLTSHQLHPSAEAEIKAEVDRFSRERKELIEQIQEVETQHMTEKKVLQDRLYDAESHDELKRVMKEKNVLAERLKKAEAA
ncbi:hypothetical protein C2S52_007865 [Perilla frutescens var. hirtella]|uniref:Uncharacterized protein n=1 Tax=Perilla frutescens var. hirtella TaxID=608512 RepID=A0AAD4P555_PERFH|nr:hypothetical protein C2S52_007865 [Perilla frutescens var. hirtella]KAH6826315.1 hypothetical protein C2S53_017664 [Perilla frutescens var. hirtella]